MAEPWVAASPLYAPATFRPDTLSIEPADNLKRDGQQSFPYRSGASKSSRFFATVQYTLQDGEYLEFVKAKDSMLFFGARWFYVMLNLEDVYAYYCVRFKTDPVAQPLGGSAWGLSIEYECRGKYSISQRNAPGSGATL